MAFDAQLLLTEGREAGGLKVFTGAPLECLITSTELFSSESQRRIVVHGEAAKRRGSKTSEVYVVADQSDR